MDEQQKITIGDIFRAWKVAEGWHGDGEGNPELATKIERKFHDLLKDQYFDKRFLIDGHMVWVDEHTPDGHVSTKITIDINSGILDDETRELMKKWVATKDRERTDSED